MCGLRMVKFLQVFLVITELLTLKIPKTFNHKMEAKTLNGMLKHFFNVRTDFLVLTPNMKFYN